MRLERLLLTLLALGAGGFLWLAPPALAAETDEPETMWDLLTEKYDANKDGVIAKDEYTRSEKAFAAMDGNEDGVLTKADYPRHRMPRPGAGPDGPGREGPPVGFAGPGPGRRGGPHGMRHRPGGERGDAEHGERCPHCGKGGGGRGPGPRGPRPDGPPPPPPPPDAVPPEER